MLLTHGCGVMSESSAQARMHNESEFQFGQVHLTGGPGQYSHVIGGTQGEG